MARTLSAPVDPAVLVELVEQAKLLFFLSSGVLLVAISLLVVAGIAVEVVHRFLQHHRP